MCLRRFFRYPLLHRQHTPSRRRLFSRYDTALLQHHTVFYANARLSDYVQNITIIIHYLYDTDMTRTMYHTCFTPDPVFGQLLFWIPDLPLIGRRRIYSDTFFLLSHVIRNIHSFYGCWRSIYGISSLAWASYISLQQRIRLFCLSQVVCLLTGDSDVYRFILGVGLSDLCFLYNYYVCDNPASTYNTFIHETHIWSSGKEALLYILQ